jgi:hypothetical protein
MKRWPPALYSVIPTMAIVVGALLLVGTPTDNAQRVVRITADPPAAAQTLQDYVAETRNAGVIPFIPQGRERNTGRVVSFEIIGLPDLAAKRCELRWAELNATDQRPATGSTWQYDDVLGWPDGLFFPGEAAEPLEGEIWVPEPAATGTFLVRLRLVCNKEEVAQGDTEWFSAPSI